MDARPTRPPTRLAAGLAVLAAVALAGCTDAPAPGEQLERDGESPLITDPGGIGNQLTNDELPDDDVVPGD